VRLLAVNDHQLQVFGITSLCTPLLVKNDHQSTVKIIS
jgi:hypothetical protein